YHGEVTDTFLCMEGPMVIETQGGRRKTELNPGERHVIPPRTAHYVSGKDGGRCRFVLVQGVGTYDYVPVEKP
ncbi:MAG: cupin domain-containing protein, partial [SAR324 cluster bacterium]|nr:cupin domain-containing protein [SAR324 cluster bacterium]MCH8888504.1 cupin domain-containing protein [SAR324 cluster bacterium]